MPDNDILDNQTTNESVAENDTNDNQTTEQGSTIVTEVINLDDFPVKIPVEYSVVYQKLLIMMIELGESILNNCKALCDKKNTPIVECYHMFKAAVAAKQLASGSVTKDNSGNTIDTRNYYAKLSDTLINYVKEQLNCVANNYKDDLSFPISLDENGQVNLFIEQTENNTEVTIQHPVNIIINQTGGTSKTIIQGFVITNTTDIVDYTLNETQANSHKYWHVINTGNRFVPGSSALYINGVRYILDDDDYEEWIITENNTSVGIGVILKTGEFDVTSPEDEIYVEAELINKD